MTSIWLIAGLLALASGPLVHTIVRSRTIALSALDGFSCTAVAGLVLLHALPDAFEHARWWALLAAIVGFFGPTSFERWRDHAAKQAHAAAVGLALVGLTIHSFIDGSVLGLGNNALALAVVLHRVPESLAIWMLLFGRRAGVLRAWTLGAMALATLVGFGFGSLLLARGFWLGLVGGLVSGSLLHVVFHRPAVAARADQRTRRLAKPIAAIGALLGAALVAGAHLLDAHHGGQHPEGGATHTARTFLALAAESAPALLVAYLGAGLLDVFMPRRTVSWLRRGSPFSQAIRGVSFGLPLPICSCGVIPLYRSLVRSGTPAAAALAFLVATPEIGVDAVLLSWPLLGARMTLARVVCAAFVAIVAGWLVGRLAEAAPEPPSDPHPTQTADSHGRVAERLRAALHSGFGEVVDNTAPWILLGLGVAALGAELIDPAYFGTLPVAASIALFALAGIPTYVCAAGATPLVTMLISQGISPGAALAFLLTGPATNATTFGVLSQLHGKRTAIVFGIVVTVLAMGLGFGVHTLLPDPDVFPLGDRQHEHGIGPFKLASAGLLGLVFLASFLRQGPRTFLSRIFRLESELDEHGSAGHGGHSHGEAACAADESASCSEARCCS